MGVYFLKDLDQIQKLNFRCLFCEDFFESRRALNSHYLTVHTEAFTEEELVMARSRRARLSDPQLP